jgi:hypothetical protein
LIMRWWEGEGGRGLSRTLRHFDVHGVFQVVRYLAGKEICVREGVRRSLMPSKNFLSSYMVVKYHQLVRWSKRNDTCSYRRWSATRCVLWSCDKV